MTEILRILKKHKRKIYLIEDSANSIKSQYKGRHCGTFGDIGLFSFDVNKVITTGTGGLLTTNDDAIYQKALALRFYGLKPTIASGYDAMRARRERWWEIELEYHGNRYQINDITSAIGLVQLKKLDAHISYRKKIYNYYNHRLSSVKSIKLPPEPPSYIKSCYYFYWIQVENEAQQLSLARHLVKNGIYTTFRYYPLHLVKYYRSLAKLPNSEQISKTTLNLPLHHNLSLSDAERVVLSIKNWTQTLK
jgi:aminotransferase